MNKKEIVFLDTETTGLHNADVIEISIVSLKNNGEKSILFNKLIKTDKKIEKGASEIHKITKQMINNHGVNFTDVYEELKEILKDKLIIVYNLKFDFKIINNMCINRKLKPFLDYDNGFCAMNLFSVIYGEYGYYFKDYKYQKLETAFYYYDHKIHEEDKRFIVPHRALGDCIMTKYLIKALLNNTKCSFNLMEEDIKRQQKIVEDFKKTLVKKGA